MKRLPVTGSNQLLDLLDPYIPDDFINEHWNTRPVRGPRWQFSPAQLWRTHLLALLTPVHSLNLLTRLLPEQRAWRNFARLRHRHGTPDVRILNAFRVRAGVLGLRQINEAILQPLIQTAALWQNATALIDATDLPAACSGFKKKTPALTPVSYTHLDVYKRQVLAWILSLAAASWPLKSVSTPSNVETPFSRLATTC